MPSYVVVGATGTIGNAVARRLAADPENLVIGLSRRALEPSVPGIKEVRGYLTALESLRFAAEEIKTLTGGKLDVLILATAQTMVPDPVMGQGEEAQIAETILSAVAQSTVGNIQIISLLLPLLKEGSIKKVVHITTGHGNPTVIEKLPVPANTALATSKGALDIAFAKFAKDFRPDGLTFLSITPSFVQSKDASSASGMDRERLSKVMSASFPDFSGIHEPDEGARIILESIDKLGLEESGKVYGMWGTQDKWA